MNDELTTPKRADSPVVRLARLLPARYRPYARLLAFRIRPTSLRRIALSSHIRKNARTCGGLGSPLYRTLLEQVAQDVAARGPCWDALATYRPSAAILDEGLGFRFMAGVHRLVLEGRAPTLAGYYPSAGGTATGDAWPVFRDVVAEHRTRLRELLGHPLQTNEVTRSRGLLGGFLLVARDTGLPLRLLELGSSAGLNLRWDAYFYDVGGTTWGDPASPVHLVDGFEDRVPALDVAAQVVDRRGCDRQPLDPSSEEDRLRLKSSIWADQLDRFTRLDGALQVAERIPAVVEAEEATAWLERQLETPVPGNATVVFHSIVMRYLTKKGRERVRSLIDAAGQRADESAPLAWLRMEGTGIQEIRLTLWPGGAERLLGTCDPQARRVRWLA